MAKKSLFSRQTFAYKSAAMALFAAVVLMVLEHQNPKRTDGLRALAHAGMSPIYTVAEKLRFTGERAGLNLQSKESIHRENLALKAKLVQANFYLQKYAEMNAQNARLRGVLSAPAPVDGRVELAQVIGIDNNPLRQILVLNKGLNQGVYVGQTVLDDSGLMGQIINAYANSSRVMLLSDSQHAISVRMARTGLRAVLAGNGDSGSLDLQYVPNTADIQVGDKLVSTGLGQRFPEGYAVGEVSFVDHEGKYDFIKVRVKPEAQLYDSHYVLLHFPSNPIKLKRRLVRDNAVVLDDDVLLEADFAADHISNTTGEVELVDPPSEGAEEPTE